MGRLLIIDDNKVDRLFIKKALYKLRDTLELIELERGFKAVDVIKDKKPQATILDVRMPGMDGFEVLRMIRNDDSLVEHPVYMVSGSEEPIDKNMASVAGANGYLTKPSSMSGYGELAKIIQCKVYGNDNDKVENKTQ